MQPKLACLSLAALLSASCEKSGTKSAPSDTSSGKHRVEKRADAETAEKPTHSADTRKLIDPPISFPVDPSMIRPAGTSPEDATWETLTAGEMIAKFRSSGIARIPKDVSDKILADATNADLPEVQLQVITQQAAAWHHINAFKDGAGDIPEHMRMMLLGRLSTKYGGSWADMVPELDEQVAASARVMELRLNGIPGMSPDESQELFINALEKHGPDYKAILAIAAQSAGK